MTKPSTIKLVSRLFALMALFPCLAAAEEKEAGEANDKLAALAVGTREAVVTMGDRAFGGIGVFISADGLALVHLQGVMGKDRVQVLVSGGKKPKFEKILGIFPEQELAVEFCPKDPPYNRASLACMYMDTGRFAEAESHILRSFHSYQTQRCL